VIRYSTALGQEVQATVDPFYAAHGSSTKARADDLFFLAYDDANLIGCVRYCIEHDTHMLRGMMVHAEYRGQRIGQALLHIVDKYFEAQKIQPIFGLPYEHLEKFYGSIGFRRIPAVEAPTFLQERLAEYHAIGHKCFCIVRK
jgi:N-acetylglutamate synthase-like GNAT family acetyltransferase